MPVVMEKFVPGFCVNRLLRIIGREVFFLLDNGYMTAEQLDLAVKASIIPRAMVLGFVQRYDFTGLDLSLNNLQNPGLPRAAASTTRRAASSSTCEKGELGVKSGQGVLRLRRPRPRGRPRASATTPFSRSSPRPRTSSTSASTRLGGRQEAMKLPAGKVIITASLNGAFVTKDMNPSVPEQPDEIAQASLDCYNAGAAIVHIHARDEQGRPCGTREKFEEIQDAVKAKCKEVIVQFSTGGGTNLTIEERVSCLDADPEMASLNMGTLMRQTGPNAGRAVLQSHRRHRGVGRQDEGHAASSRRWSATRRACTGTCATSSPRGSSSRRTTSTSCSA